MQILVSSSCSQVSIRHKKQLANLVGTHHSLLHRWLMHLAKYVFCGHVVYSQLNRNAWLAGRWCEHCHAWQELRAKHCHVCMRCIMRFDHHCAWTGNCIGENNHARQVIPCAISLKELTVCLLHAVMCDKTCVGQTNDLWWAGPQCNCEYAAIWGMQDDCAW